MNSTEYVIRNNELVMRKFNETDIAQRRTDRFLNATAMCKASAKQWSDYWRLQTTQEFVVELSTVLGIPVTDLIESRAGGTSWDQGTWVHPRVAVNLAQWCSPKFAVAVSAWVEELLTTGATVIQETDPMLQSITAIYNLRKSQLALEVATQKAQLTANIAQESADKAQRRADQGMIIAQAALDVFSCNYGHFSVLGYCRKTGRTLTAKEAIKHGKRLTKICKSRSIPVQSVNDTRFGTVNTYREDVLTEYFAFAMPVPVTRN